MNKGLLSAGLLLVASYAFAGVVNKLDRVVADGIAESGEQRTLRTVTFAMDVSQFKRGDNPAQCLGYFRMNLQSANNSLSVRMPRASGLQIEDVDENGKKITVQGQAILTRGSYFGKREVKGSITIIITDRSGDSEDTLQITFTQSGFAGLPSNNSFTFSGTVISGQLKLTQREWES